MNKEALYVESDEFSEKKEPAVLSILSLVFGIASIVLCGPLGVIFGALAGKFSDYVLSVNEQDKRAAVGQITGSVGLAMSIVSVALLALLITVIIWLAVYAISGYPII